MILSVECSQCEADFEIELGELIDDPTLITCPNCGIKGDPEIVEAVAASLDEAVAMLTRLRHRFRVQINLDMEDIEGEGEEIFDDEDSLWTTDVEEEEEELED